MGSEEKELDWWDGTELLQKSPNNGKFYLLKKKKKSASH